METLANRIFLALALGVAGLATACASVDDEQAGVLSQGLLDDGASHPPPTTGSYAYNSFVPAAAGSSYTDPVLGSVVRRITADQTGDDIYARNMFWNANGTRYLHRNTMGGPNADFLAVVDTATGQITHNGIPIGSVAADVGFDPVDPNVLYYYSGSTIRRVTLGSGSTWTDAVYFTAPAEILELGGSMNWLDASGRYMVVRYGSEPSVRVYDRQNMAAGPYTNPVSAQYSIENGSYVGITPDGKYLVGYENNGTNGSGHGGFWDLGQGVSWALNHATRTIASAPIVFWSLCGDHGSFLSASDDRNYMVVADCGNESALWRVDITNNAAGLDVAQQQALPNNLKLIAWPVWLSGAHMTTVAKGSLVNWAFVSTEDATDEFNDGIADWHAYRQEIMGFNVITGEIQRLAHHRSRSIGSNYRLEPRVSASWGGEYVGWASNFNQPGDSIDTYVLQPAGSGSGGGSGSPSPVQWTSLVNVTLSSGTLTKTGGCHGCPDAGAISQQQIISGDGYVEFTVTAATGVIVGLSNGNPGTTGDEIDFGLNVLAGYVEVREGGLYKADTGIATGSTLRIAVVGGQVRYSVNGVVFYTSTTSPTYPLLVDTWFGASSSAIANAVIGSGSGTGGMPPSVSITAPAAGATITGTTTLTASASDDIGVGSVQFQIDGANFGSPDTVAPYSIAWTPTVAQNGTHSIRAIARDAVPNSTTSSAVSVTVAIPNPPTISSVAASAITSSGATITWTTNQASDTQVEYGTTTYDNSTTLNTSQVTSHSQALSGLSASTTYNYRVKSRNAAGNLATSGNFTFTTAAAGPVAVQWTSLVNVTFASGTLTKTGGCQGCPDAGARSAQTIASGSGYVQFTVPSARGFTLGLSNGNPGTSGTEIKFGINVVGGGVNYVEVRESGVYRTDITVATGNILRIAVVGTQVRYSKNGVVFYTSTLTPTYPLLVDTSFLGLGAAVAGAVTTGS